MAGTGRIIASIYGYEKALGGSYNFPGVTGRSNTFPGALTQLYPAPASTTINGVTILSVVEVLPTGLNQGSTKYYAAAAVATIEAAST